MKRIDRNLSNKIKKILGDDLQFKQRGNTLVIAHYFRRPSEFHARPPKLSRAQIDQICEILEVEDVQVALGQDRDCVQELVIDLSTLELSDGRPETAT